MAGSFFLFINGQKKPFMAFIDIAIRTPLSRIRLNCGRDIKSGKLCQKQLASRHLDILSGNVVFE